MTLRFVAATREPVREGPLGRLIVHRGSLPDVDFLRREVGALRRDECVACAIQLTGPPAHRLRALLTFRRVRRSIERAMREAGTEIAGRFGVDPNLDAPSCIYELETTAAEYADRFVRPRGRSPAARRLVARVLGCDPALGAVLIVGRRK